MGDAKDRLARAMSEKGRTPAPRRNPTAPVIPSVKSTVSNSSVSTALHHGDCREVLKQYPDGTFHAIITDPGVGVTGDMDGWSRGVPGPEFWTMMLLKSRPGAHLAIFSGRKRDHWIKAFAEDAGWEYRDTLLWIYPKGMPMAIDIGQAVDKKMGGSGVPYFRSVGSMTDEQRDIFQAEAASNPWYGWGTELRPTWEPIALLRKPFSSSVADNVIKNDVGPMNIDATRIPLEEERDAIATYIPPGQGEAHGLALTKYQKAVGKTTLGRWPADALFSHHEDCTSSGCAPPCAVLALEEMSEGAAKYFYCPKASRADKDMGLGAKGNTAKSVKPERLMTWLVDLLLPTGGALLDPFMGTGSTGIPMARRESIGRGSFVGIEQELAYLEMASKRLEAARVAGTG